MNLIINCPEDDIELLKRQHGSCAVIEFYDKQYSPLRIDRVGEYTLRICAFDWSERNFKPGSDELYKANGWQIFGEDQAHAIKRFVDEVKGNIDTLIVACSAGISRSSATAMYIAGRWQTPWLPNWSVTPNMTIYNVLEGDGRGLILPPAIKQEEANS